MRILHVMKWLSSSENTGGKIRAFRIGKALSSFARVDAAGFVLSGEEPTGNENHLSHYHRLYPFPMLRGVPRMREVLTSFTQGLSLRTTRFLPGTFGIFLKRILRENRYDAIQVEELPLMASLHCVPLDIPVIFSSHNVESELSYRLFSNRNPFIKRLAAMESRRTMQEEINALARARVSVAVSERDRDLMLTLCRGRISDIRVLPNCASDRFQPSPQGLPGRGVLTVGSFGWYPNQDGLMWFVDQVLPLLRKAFPGEIIRVAGSGIGRTLRKRLAHQEIRVFPDVPDMLPFLQEARLLFVPLRIGGGTRIKILEAWAAGLPVVSTSIGAEGLPYRPGVNMLIADDAKTFAAAIGRLLDDDGLYGMLRSEGLKTSQNFRWSGMSTPFADIYKNVLKNREIASL
ncbi:MAG: glycosyltransferase family 4 protein [Smithellaceae bacterium]